MLHLNTLWFVIIAILWVGFFVLEGFDFGVGMLHMIVGKTEDERRLAVSTIGPWWDGNEVWLIVAGAGTFAAFPSWYATMFSALYLALLLVLAALMARGVALEYTTKSDDERWRRAWRWALTIGSLLIPLLLGVGLGDLLNGLPINSSHEFTGNFFDLLTGYGLWTGLTLLALCLLHGATFLKLRTTGQRARARRRAGAPAGMGGDRPGRRLRDLDAQRRGRPRRARPGGGPGGDRGHLRRAADDAPTTTAGPSPPRRSRSPRRVGSIFINLYPNVMVSSTNAAYNLTVSNSASGHYALTVMTIVTVIFFPIVLIYQGWSFHVFRGRLKGPAPASDPPPGAVPAAPQA